MAVNEAVVLVTHDLSVISRTELPLIKPKVSLVELTAKDTDQPDQHQIDRHDVVEKTRYEQNQNSREQRDKG